MKKKMKTGPAIACRLIKQSIQWVGVVVIVVLAVSRIDASDLQDGIFDVPWGTDISSLTDFVKMAEHQEVSYYVNPGRVYKIADITISQVLYGFYSGQFFAAYVELEDIEAFSRIKRYINTKYGYPDTTLTAKNEQTIYNWKYNDTKIKLKVYEKTGKMKLGFYYRPLSRKVNEAQQEAFQEESRPLFPLDGARQQRAVEMMELLQF
ncbi:MAG: hypothetical protein JSW39_00875 [Desulfobacterales bacterium]|nr:MAG: hypothetical protein JSW39_00875 [Desulfobacterales bacterium]